MKKCKECYEEMVPDTNKLKWYCTWCGYSESEIIECGGY